MIDLRSDTVTMPTAEMRDFMFKAELGDDVYGEDPSVNRLQDLAAGMTGHQAALYVASGTQGNLISILTHCQRGDEYIAGQQAHTYRFEGGGAAVLGSVQPQPIPFNERGELDLNEVRAVIKPNDHHFARTRLICLENTQAGRALDLAYLSEFHEFARESRLATHLDGARVFNAAIASNVDVSQIPAPFGSVSLCLSKGLGCPVGSIICSDKGFIDEARKWRKMLGGGMRQAGMMAAAGIFALKNHVERLASDHENAEVLLDPSLADVLDQPPWPERELELLLVGSGGPVDDPLVRHGGSFLVRAATRGVWCGNLSATPGREQKGGRTEVLPPRVKPVESRG